MSNQFRREFESELEKRKRNPSLNWLKVSCSNFKKFLKELRDRYQKRKNLSQLSQFLQDRSKQAAQFLLLKTLRTEKDQPITSIKELLRLED